MMGKKTGDRQKDSLNKTTVAVKDVLERVFEGIDGEKAMVTWTKANQTELYKHYVKLLPLTLEGNPDKPMSP